MKEKRQVLLKIAKTLNDQHITWAIGGSLLLYLHELTDHFNDIDIMTTEADVHRIDSILSALGTKKTPSIHSKYETKFFYEFEIDGVDIDVMAGMVIVKEGQAYPCDLAVLDIQKNFYMDGILLPTQTLKTWRHYYDLMGRTDKLDLIDEQSFGVVVYCHSKPDKLYLILKHQAGHWSFPKGHKIENETDMVTAKREVKEETGLDVQLVSNQTWHHRFMIDEGVYKKVTYFVGKSHTTSVTLQISEIAEAQWCCYEEALVRLTHIADQKILTNIHHFLNQY
jgi:8-oxo-dGTP pyrophosphatase MutT (NUDIX family)